MEKFQRLQGNDWHLVKNSFRLLYTYKSDNGNIKGIYTDGKTKISHWLNDEEKFEQLQQENKKLNGTIQTYDILLKANVEENKQLKNLIDIILNFSFFKEECPLNFGFENNTNEDKSQSVFYEDEWCENNCNDNYKNCWLKYFKKLQELEGSDSNE